MVDTGYEVRVTKDNSTLKNNWYEFSSQIEAIDFASNAIKLDSVLEVTVYDGERVIRVFT